MLVTGCLMDKVSAARTVAFDVLMAAANGAYAADTILARAGTLESRDAGLASQIVFGCLRFQAQLDYLIFLYSGRRVSQLDQPVVIALRTGIFQLRYLDRVPPHAAVNETVELVKTHRRAAAGFSNAVLRKVDRQVIAWPDFETEASCPRWLIDRWTEHFGAEQARRIALAALQEPAGYVRVPPAVSMPTGLDLEPTEVDGCFRLATSGGAIRAAQIAGFRLQDIGSQAVIPWLDLQAGDSYLDLCAAPGNKTMQALEAPVSFALACDISFRRIREIPPICPRVVLDATCPLPFAHKFDGILLDAPCSGTGTLGRNPEIKWRVQPKDFTRFREKQVRMLRRGLQHLAKSGKLLYATCSLEREENEDVIREGLAEQASVRLEQEMWRRPGRDAGDGFYVCVLVNG